MKIAVFGYAHPFGEGTLYGAERIIYYMVQELKKRGHECVVFSIEGCKLPGFEFVVVPTIWKDDRDIYLEAVEKYEKENNMKFDFIHSFQASGCISARFIEEWNYCLEPFFGFHRFSENIIAYSHKLGSVNGGSSTVIQYGIPDDLYSDEVVPSDDYLVWIGRIDMGKAPDIAIDVAKRAGKRIILMGHSYHYPYFVEKIFPQIDNDKVIWIRGVSDDLKKRIFKKALGFLSTNWCEYHEMFGIVNIEALACGCPVIGWGHKQYPSEINFEGGKIIEDGTHGFIVEYPSYSEAAREASIDHAVKCVNLLPNIDRGKCRQLFLDKFTTRTMVDKIEKYYEIVKTRKKVLNVTNEL